MKPAPFPAHSSALPRPRAGRACLRSSSPLPFASFWYLRRRFFRLSCPASRGTPEGDWGLLARPRAAFCGGAGKLRRSPCFFRNRKPRRCGCSVLIMSCGLLGPKGLDDSDQILNEVGKQERRSPQYRWRAGVVPSSPCPRERGALERESARG